MTVGQPLDPRLGWVPTFFFTINDHVTVACEVSETPYPIILGMRRKDIEDVSNPIAVYSICSEEAYLTKQTDAKDIMKHGFGLLTVDSNGKAQLRSGCIPLIQQISQATFKAEIDALPQKVKRRLAEAFDRYKQSAPSGVADLSEVVEGMVLRAGLDAVRQTWINANKARPGYSAATIDALLGVPQAVPAAAALGGVRSFISVYRNASHHFPKNKKQAHIKYQTCKHAFIEGVKQICQFRDAMKLIGLSGLLPNG